MKTFKLNGELRQDLGKKSTKALRKEGLVPCVLYGAEENVHFTVTQRDVHHLIYTPEVFIVELTIDGKITNSIIKELQFHPVSDELLHMDFFMVSKDKPVAMDIPVILTGFAAGVREGGKLTLEARKVRVKGIYTDFPENIVLDVTKLKLGNSIQVGDINIDKLEMLDAKEAVVAQVKLTRLARGMDAAEGEDEEGEEGEEGEAAEETATEETTE